MGYTPSARARRWKLAQVIFLVVGTAVLATMAIAAHSLAYFPGDVPISRAVQAYGSDWLDAFLSAVSWLGFPPQSNVLFGLIVIALFAGGARWAGATTVIAAITSGGAYLLIQQLVGQPRPEADLIRVAGPLPMTGFPSGHLATFTAVFGFLAFLGYRRLAPSRARWLPVAGAGLFLALMSFARMYSGQHWPSDVCAGCLLGGLCLMLVIRLYTWGEGRLSHRAYAARLGNAYIET
jgi:membrane-associated phospholipid phosphatase